MMKSPMILTLLAAAIGSTAVYATGAPVMTGMYSEDLAPMAQLAPEPQSAVVGHDGIEAGWLRLISSDDDDDDDDDEDEGCDDDDDDCKQGMKSAPKAPSTPPQNGLFNTGKPPVVKSN